MKSTCKELVEPYGVIYEIDGVSSSLSMSLPKNDVYDMTLSGWIFSRVLNAKIPSVQLLHASGSAFVPISQFSLSKPEATPLFRAFGENATKVLETVREAYLNFNAEDFDEDGYYRK